MILFHDRQRLALMRVVAIGVQEGNRECLDPFRDEAIDRLAERILIERTQHRASRVDALIGLGAQMARHERLRLFEEEVIKIVANFVTHLQDVTESLGGDQADLGALALDDGVGDERGAMNDVVEPADVDAGFLRGCAGRPR